VTEAGGGSPFMPQSGDVPPDHPDPLCCPRPAAAHPISLARPAHAASVRVPVRIDLSEPVPSVTAGLPGIHSRRAAAAQHVRANRRESHMSRVTAATVSASGSRGARCRVMAQMVNGHASRYRAVDHLPENTVCFPALSAEPEFTVSVIEAVTRPWPFSICCTPRNLRPEPVFCARQGRQRARSLVLPVMRVAQSPTVNEKPATRFRARIVSRFPLAHGIYSNSEAA
jgi:hypothetical protein